MDMDRGQKNKEIVHFWDEDATEHALCGTNVMVTAYAHYANIWAEVDCKDCLKFAPAGEVKSRSTIASVQLAPADRTVENMIAAAAHIRYAVQRKIDEDGQRGETTPARDIISLIETIHATYETMLLS